MTTALLEDKVDFVRLLLQNGVVMREYLTIDRLRSLYNSVSQIDIEGNNALYFFWEKLYTMLVGLNDLNFIRN